MAITTQDTLISARAAKTRAVSFRRLSVVNMAAGQMCSMYRSGSTSSLMPQPAIPTTAALCTKALSWNFPTPGGTDQSYVDYLEVGLTLPGRVTHFDRLFHIGGLNGTLTTAQTVNSQTVLTLPARNSDPAEVEWFLEWYADTGATATTANVAVTYTDTTTSTVAVALAATMRIGRLLPIPPLQGKIITSIQSVTLLATTGTAGNFGVSCGDRMSRMSMGVQVGNIPPPPKQAILRSTADNTCFWQVIECSTTSTGDLAGEMTLIEG